MRHPILTKPSETPSMMQTVQLSKSLPAYFSRSLPLELNLPKPSTSRLSLSPPARRQRFQKSLRRSKSFEEEMTADVPDSPPTPPSPPSKDTLIALAKRTHVCLLTLHNKLITRLHRLNHLRLPPDFAITGSLSHPPSAIWTCLPSELVHVASRVEADIKVLKAATFFSSFGSSSPGAVEAANEIRSFWSSLDSVASGFPYLYSLSCIPTPEPSRLEDCEPYLQAHFSKSSRLPPGIWAELACKIIGSRYWQEVFSGHQNARLLEIEGDAWQKDTWLSEGWKMPTSSTIKDLKRLEKIKGVEWAVGEASGWEWRMWLMDLGNVGEKKMGPPTPKAVTPTQDTMSQQGVLEDNGGESRPEGKRLEDLKTRDRRKSSFVERLLRSRRKCSVKGKERDMSFGVEIRPADLGLDVSDSLDGSAISDE